MQGGEEIGGGGDDEGEAGADLDAFYDGDGDGGGEVGEEAGGAEEEDGEGDEEAGGYGFADGVVLGDCYCCYCLEGGVLVIFERFGWREGGMMEGEGDRGCCGMY